jgi:ankyrin repeat protein
MISFGIKYFDMRNMSEASPRMVERVSEGTSPRPRLLARPGRRALGACLLIVIVCTAALRGAGSDVVDAVMNRDHAALQALINKKADVNAPQRDGATALHWAVYNDDATAADLLLRAGAKPNVANRTGMTPLAMAALYGSAPLVDKLLKAGADAKALGPNGETMLMYAARNGRPAAVKLLVEAGVDVNAKERLRGTTALMWAVEQRHPEAVAVLLESGADHAAKSSGAGLPRNYLAPRVNTRAVEEAQKRRVRAQQAGRTYEEQLEFEYENGMDLGASRNAFTPNRARGAQPPAAAGGGARGGAAAATPAPAAPAAPATSAPAPAAAVPDDDDSEVIVAGLVGSGGGGLTALTFAAREGDVESARRLLDAGADVNQATENGRTPLLTAVNNRNYKMAEFLLAQGADPNLANKGGWTPLYLATDNRNIEGGDYPVPKPDMDHLDIIKLLLAKGANPNIKVKDDTLTRTIFTMQWFFEDGATPFIRAAQSSDTVLMKLLLEHGADPKAATANGDNAMTASSGIGWVEGVTYERSKEENYEAMKMLLDLGIDPNYANSEGRTSLMGAAMKGRPEVIQLLVDRGAKLDTYDKGSRDTDKVGSAAAGHVWQAIDYAEGLVRVGVQSAVFRTEAAQLIRKLMAERNLPAPPVERNILSVCVVALCQGIPMPKEPVPQQ